MILGQVNSELRDLQGLFDEVNGQLLRESGRIEKLQGAVTHCAKQSKELESLQKMLEESHRMLAQLRDSLDKERQERLRVAGLLEHEQQRTQLLLDVLKHFKEKLQGLTPETLLSRLADPKVAGFSSPQGLLDTRLSKHAPNNNGYANNNGVHALATPPMAQMVPLGQLGVSPGPEWLTPSPKPPSWPPGGLGTFEVPVAPLATPPQSTLCGAR